MKTLLQDYRGISNFCHLFHHRYASCFCLLQSSSELSPLVGSITMGDLQCDTLKESYDARHKAIGGDTRGLLPSILANIMKFTGQSLLLHLYDRVIPHCVRVQFVYGSILQRQTKRPTSTLPGDILYIQDDKPDAESPSSLFPVHHPLNTPTLLLRLLSLLSSTSPSPTSFASLFPILSTTDPSAPKSKLPTPEVPGALPGGLKGEPSIFRVLELCIEAPFVPIDVTVIFLSPLPTTSTISVLL